MPRIVKLDKMDGDDQWVNVLANWKFGVRAELKMRNFSTTSAVRKRTGTWIRPVFGDLLSRSLKKSLRRAGAELPGDKYGEMTIQSLGGVVTIPTIWDVLLRAVRFKQEQKLMNEIFALDKTPGSPICNRVQYYRSKKDGVACLEIEGFFTVKITMLDQYQSKVIDNRMLEEAFEFTGEGFERAHYRIEYFSKNIELERLNVPETIVMVAIGLGRISFPKSIRPKNIFYFETDEVTKYYIANNQIFEAETSSENISFRFLNLWREESSSEIIGSMQPFEKDIATMRSIDDNEDDWTVGVWSPGDPTGMFLMRDGEISFKDTIEVDQPDVIYQFLSGSEYIDGSLCENIKMALSISTKQNISYLTHDKIPMEQSVSLYRKTELDMGVLFETILKLLESFGLGQNLGDIINMLMRVNKGESPESEFLLNLGNYIEDEENFDDDDGTIEVSIMPSLGVKLVKACRSQKYFEEVREDFIQMLGIRGKAIAVLDYYLKGDREAPYFKVRPWSRVKYKALIPMKLVPQVLRNIGLKQLSRCFEKIDHRCVFLHGVDRQYLRNVVMNSSDHLEGISVGDIIDILGGYLGSF
jgi:hypothetical protein